MTLSDGSTMSTENFRRQLRHESNQWKQEGLIDSSLYNTLAERYGFSQLTDDHSNRFIGILLGLGGILLGLGAITFVAANWQDWSRVARTVLLLVLFLGVNGAGFYLWRSPGGRLHRLGHGLLLTGGLVLGANLGLMSQMFHQSGPIYQLFLVWSLGVLAMAYGLRLVSLGVLSWILMMLGYWNFAGTFPSGTTDLALLPQVVTYLPLLVSFFYLPLAHWLRSRWLYGLWGISFAILFSQSQAAWFFRSGYPIWAIAFAFVLPPALLWVYRADFGVGLRHRPQGRTRDLFQPVGRSLSIWSLSFTLYWFSFRFPWQDVPFERIFADRPVSIVSPSITLIFYGAIAVYGWWQVVRFERRVSQSRWLISPVLGGSLCILYGAGIAYLRAGSSFSVFGPVVINILLFGLSVCLIHDGLYLGIRRRFWGGMIVLVIALISRMFEYNTDLTLKAIVLSLCGLGIIAAGLGFEYRAKQSAAFMENNR